jgi:hypothetical protein
MSVYDYNVTEVGKQLIPPVLRRAKLMDFVNVLLSQVTWAKEYFFTHYCNFNQFFWASAGIYSIDDVVYYLSNKRSYICISNGGVGLNYAPVGGIYSSEKWLEISDNFIGLDTRKYYTGQNIVLISAINDWLQTTTQKVYIDYAVKVPPSYYRLFVPFASWAQLGATTTERDNAIKQFVNTYTVAGFDFTIVTY